MKYFYCTLSLLLLLLPAFAQESVAGKYKLFTSGDSSEIIQGTVLTLHCNNSFINYSPHATGYGKWELKNDSSLVIQFDSIAYDINSEIIKTKTTYTIKDGRIFRTSISKKEYRKNVKDINHFLRVTNSPFRNGIMESYEVYRAKGLRMYSQLWETISCR